MPLPPNTLAELQRDMARLGFVVSQIREIEEARQKRLEQRPETGRYAMVRLLARIVGVGVETADMLVHELLSRPMRDRRAVARYAALTGSPDESGARRREQGLARAGNARVRRGMIQLAWRFLIFQKESALALWYRARAADSHSGTRKTIVVAGTQTGHCALALCHHWRDIGGRHPASGKLKAREEHSLTYSALVLAFKPTAELTIRGGGKPYSNVAPMSTRRMGPPPGASPPMRMTASWSRIKRSYRIQVCGTKMRPQWRAPFGSSGTGQPRSHAKSPPRSSSSLRVLRRQGAAKHKRC
jgi:Transposase IS116/IS110/IS902 family